MYHLLQLFRFVFEDTATVSGIGLLLMMFGLLIGNPIAAFITSKNGVSLSVLTSSPLCKSTSPRGNSRPWILCRRSAV
ncbi:hypothetical protein F5Y05DRAFT_396252 [Hypoxylon sp. FL0543]|nr:hypothetical protein F5Y05DRAFT_396252 [Hypoxylon sp. FL0543]